MNREDTKKAIEVMQAYVDGADVECLCLDAHQDGWIKEEPEWMWDEYKYRVKPKPREFWVDSQNYSVIMSEPDIMTGWIHVREVIE